MKSFLWSLGIITILSNKPSHLRKEIRSSSWCFLVNISFHNLNVISQWGLSLLLELSVEFIPYCMYLEKSIALIITLLTTHCQTCLLLSWTPKIYFSCGTFSYLKQMFAHPICKLWINISWIILILFEVYEFGKENLLRVRNIIVGNQQIIWFEK